MRNLLPMLSLPALLLALAIVPMACDPTTGDDDDGGACADGEVGDDNDGDGWRTCGLDGLVDCDDDDPNVNPETNEICGDGADNDCSGIAEDADLDEDGVIAEDCGGEDCDDTDASSNPGGTESCDGADNDCDGTIDDGFDADDDGFPFCAGDCADGDPNVNPDAPELCDGLDNDCDCETRPSNRQDTNDDGLDCGPGDEFVDEDFDADGDGYIDANDAFCSGIYGPNGTNPELGDCDDDNADVLPFSGEIRADGLDNDCDTCVDECQDVDGDGYDTCAPGDPGDPTCPVFGEDGNDDGNEADCADSSDIFDSIRYPGFTFTLQTQQGPVVIDEQCDQLDNDCDGEVDEGWAPDCSEYVGQ